MCTPIRTPLLSNGSNIPATRSRRDPKLSISLGFKFEITGEALKVYWASTNSSCWFAGSMSEGNREWDLHGWLNRDSLRQVFDSQQQKKIIDNFQDLVLLSRFCELILWNHLTRSEDEPTYIVVSLCRLSNRPIPFALRSPILTDWSCRLHIASLHLNHPTIDCSNINPLILFILLNPFTTHCKSFVWLEEVLGESTILLTATPPWTYNDK